MKHLSVWPAVLTLVGGAVFAQVASEPAATPKAGPAVQPDSSPVRERFENAMERRQQMRIYEQAVAQTGRQIRATSQAQTRIREAIRIQEALITQEQEDMRGYGRDTPPHMAMVQQQAQHQKLLEQLRSQDEQLSRLQEQLKAQQQDQQQRRDQQRQR